MTQERQYAGSTNRPRGNPYRIDTNRIFWRVFQREPFRPFMPPTSLKEIACLITSPQTGIVSEAFQAKWK